MPYEISFTKRLKVAPAGHYINPCCWGGDIVRDRLLPCFLKRSKLITGQEDWGWYIWFREGKVRYEIDIHCDNAGTGEFRVRLTSRLKKLFQRSQTEDRPPLEDIKTEVLANLEYWAGSVTVERTS